MARQLFTIPLITVLFLALGIASEENGWLGVAVPPVLAHCDTMDGPVVKAAQNALATGDLAGVMIWVKQSDEAAIREAFEKTLAVRKLDPRAKDLADMYFFETLVRLHRAGEGAPYEGILPAGSEVEPGIAAADMAVEAGQVDGLINTATAKVADGIRGRFVALMENKQRASQSVNAGREYVAAYVAFIHYVEGLFKVASSEPPHHGESGEEAPEGVHQD